MRGPSQEEARQRLLRRVACALEAGMPIDRIQSMLLLTGRELSRLCAGLMWSDPERVSGVIPEPAEPENDDWRHDLDEPAPRKPATVTQLRRRPDRVEP